MRDPKGVPFVKTFGREGQGPGAFKAAFYRQSE